MGMAVFGQALIYVAGMVFVAAMIVLFVGDPDLHDAWIKQAMECNK